jgi:acyl-CoA thioester hydrolase
MKASRGARGEAVDLARITYWARIEVRYSDLDVQGHVNNATFFTYFEQARVAYFADMRAHFEAARAARGEAGTVTWTSNAATPDLPFVIASASCAYKRPIPGLAPVYVGIRCAGVSHAAIEMQYAICAAPGETLYATGSTLTAWVSDTLAKDVEEPGASTA